MPADPDWAAIVRENVAVVTNAALRVLGSVSDAEDVAQDVFLEAFRKFEPNAGHSWAGHLRRMAICRALDLLRSRVASAVLEFQPIDFREPSVDCELLRQERHDQLRNAVRELPPREAEVFCLALFEQQSHEEMAATAKDKDHSAEEIAALQKHFDAAKQQTSQNIAKLEAALKSGKPIKHRQVSIQGRYLQRIEQDEGSGKRIMISNAETGEEVWIDPATRILTQMKNHTAVPMKVGGKTVLRERSGDKSFSDLEPRPEENFYARFAAVSTKKLAPLPAKQLDGVTVLGFQEAEVKTNFTAVRTFWINKATQLPIRIDVVLTQAGIVVGGFSQSYFVFDAPLDSALFSTEAPEGYTVRESGFINIIPAN